MGVITTSIVVDFTSADGSGLLRAEIDARELGYNKGITSFIPGDSPVFLLYKSSGVTITSIESSEGVVSKIATDIHTNTIDGPEYLTYVNAKQATPKYPILSNFTSKWLGTPGGLVSTSELSVNIPDSSVSVLKVEYNTSADAYRLSNIPTVLNGETSFPVVIYISGEAV